MWILLLMCNSTRSDDIKFILKHVRIECFLGSSQHSCIPSSSSLMVTSFLHPSFTYFKIVPLVFFSFSLSPTCGVETKRVKKKKRHNKKHWFYFLKKLCELFSPLWSTLSSISIHYLPIRQMYSPLLVVPNSILLSLLQPSNHSFAQKHLLEADRTNSRGYSAPWNIWTESSFLYTLPILLTSTKLPSWNLYFHTVVFT